MAGSKNKLRSQKLLPNLEAMAAAREVDEQEEGGEASDTTHLAVLSQQPIDFAPDSSKIPRLKRFRFQLLHQWLIQNFAPCKAADIGGGKGLLGYLLAKSGWQVTVIDPVQQPLPDKYRDILSGQRIKIDPRDQVACLPAEFEIEMAAGFDLLLAMHAHGCNARIIDAAARYGCAFVIFPCCVIGEPFYPRLGVHWLESLADYALYRGCAIRPFRLNFKGQNIGLCGRAVNSPTGLNGFTPAWSVQGAVRNL